MAVTQDIVNASNDFDAKAAHTRLHQIAQESVVGNRVTQAEMVDVYTNKMARRGSPGRAVYDALITSPPLGICPLCAHRDVATLDHHLPKAHYPALAVTPLNLVPACYNCNKAKQSKLPTTASEETLHPYYDDISGDRWLYAEVIQTDPAALRFFVIAPAHWAAVLAKRVDLHFRTFGLAQLYSVQAANELINMREDLRSIHLNGGANVVRVELAEGAKRSRKIRLNSWRAVSLEAFAASDWFCNGGFG